MSIGLDNPVRVINAFVDEPDLMNLGSYGTTPALAGSSSHHLGVMLKIYIYEYLNRGLSSRSLDAARR